MNRYRSLGLRAGILACALIFVLGALPVMAQDAAPTIKTASLLLWPEYDDPGLLVIFAGDFADPTGFPRDISIPLPAGARNVQAAYPDTAGGLLNANSEISESDLIYKQLPVSSFHLEYYVDRQPSGNQREIVYSFQAPYAIEALAVTVQQPARATDFSVDPAAAGSETRDDGLTYYIFERTDLAAGDTLKIVLRYTKTDSGVSSPQLAVTNSSPTPAAPSTSSSSPDIGAWLPWVFIGAGAITLTAFFVHWLLSRRRRPAPETSKRPNVPSTRVQRTPGPAADAADFCTQCGHRHRPDDRFCAQCGAPRRG